MLVSLLKQITYRSQFKGTYRTDNPVGLRATNVAVAHPLPIGGFSELHFITN